MFTLRGKINRAHIALMELFRFRCLDVCSPQCNVSTYQATRLDIPEGNGGSVQHQDLDPAHAEADHGAVQEEQPGHRGGERGGQARHQPQTA